MVEITTLQEAIDLVRQGQKAQARALLEEVLRADSSNETAWLWLADCAETREEGIQALKTCLETIPHASRARAALEILSSEKNGSTRTEMLADRLIAADKNIKSRPRYRLQSGKSVHDLLKPVPKKVRLDFDPDLVTEDSAVREPAVEEAEVVDPVLTAPEQESATDAALAEPQAQIEDLAIDAPVAGALIYELPEQPQVLEQPAPPAEITITEEDLLDKIPAPPARPLASWEVDTVPRQPLDQSTEQVDAFTISPELFTAEELKALEESLGTVPVARRRISLLQNPGEAWRSLTEDLPEETPRPVQSQPPEEPSQPRTVLAYLLMLMGGVVLLTLLVMMVAVFLGAL